MRWVTGVTIAAVILLALAAVAGGEAVRVGNVQIGFSGDITPSRLPRYKRVKTSIELAATIDTTDGSNVPRVDTVSIETNRHGRIDTRGLPTCSSAAIANTLTAEAKEICGGALIGTGQASAQIVLPGQPPFEATGEMLIFNGHREHGRATLLVHVYAFTPAPTIVVTSGVVRQGGKAGPRMTFTIPPILDEQGSLTGFAVTFDKVIRANCPAPPDLPGAVFPFARATFGFADGKEVQSVLVRHCTIQK